MYGHGEKACWRYRSGLAGAITVAMAACLTATACSVSSRAPQAPSASLASPAAQSRTSGGGLGLNNAPLSSAFASQPVKISPHGPFTGPPADPFSGTPADHWANGAAGIALPAARPVDGYTTAQVEFAYATTRKLLIAANLDRRTLLGGRPTAFASLLTSQQRTWFLQALNKTGLGKQGAELSTRTLVVSFAPGGTQLIGDVIKVRGTMRARGTTDKNGYKVLDVDADYIFVYPVQPPGQPTDWMRVVAQNSWTVMFGYWQGAATPFEPWVDSSNFIAGIKCGAMDGYIHPDYPVVRTAQPTESATGAPVDPYALGNSGTAGCRATTGT